ncbi:MAG: hypothetical protein WC700_19970, partial [Gemmatimonadaceae bacterium]
MVTYGEFAAAVVLAAVIAGTLGLVLGGMLRGAKLADARAVEERYARLLAVHARDTVLIQDLRLGRAYTHDLYRRQLAAGMATCAECVGYAALNDCAQLGARVWVRHERTGAVVGPLLSVDCATGADLAERERQGRVVEVSYAQAVAWGMRGPEAVSVFGGGAMLCEWCHTETARPHLDRLACVGA